MKLVRLIIGIAVLLAIIGGIGNWLTGPHGADKQACDTAATAAHHMQEVAQKLNAGQESPEDFATDMHNTATEFRAAAGMAKSAKVAQVLNESATEIDGVFNGTAGRDEALAVLNRADSVCHE